MQTLESGLVSDEGDLPNWDGRDKYFSLQEKLSRDRHNTQTERGLEKIDISGHLLTFRESYYSTEQLLPWEEENVSFKEAQIKLDKASKRRL